MLDSSDDALLAATVALAQAGDRSAAGELIVACNELVVRVVRAHRIRSLPEEDLIQEVFLHMLEHLDGYAARPEVSFRHWLGRLAVNLCLDRVRGEVRRTRRLVSVDNTRILDWLCDGAALAPDDALAAADVAETLLAGLAAEDRLVITLIDLERRPALEVARLTGWSESLVRVRAFRARQRLRVAAQHIQNEMTLGETHEPLR